MTFVDKIGSGIQKGFTEVKNFVIRLNDKWQNDLHPKAKVRIILATIGAAAAAGILAGVLLGPAGLLLGLAVGITVFTVMTWKYKTTDYASDLFNQAADNAKKAFKDLKKDI